jgi:hypothetical protein
MRTFSLIWSGIGCFATVAITVLGGVILANGGRAQAAENRIETIYYTGNLSGHTYEIEVTFHDSYVRTQNMQYTVPYDRFKDFITTDYWPSTDEMDAQIELNAVTSDEIKGCFAEESNENGDIMLVLTIMYTRTDLPSKMYDDSFGFDQFELIYFSAYSRRYIMSPLRSNEIGYSVIFNGQFSVEYWSCLRWLGSWYGYASGYYEYSELDEHQYYRYQTIDLRLVQEVSVITPRI